MSVTNPCVHLQLRKSHPAFLYIVLPRIQAFLVLFFLMVLTNSSSVFLVFQSFSLDIGGFFTHFQPSPCYCKMFIFYLLVSLLTLTYESINYTKKHLTRGLSQLYLQSKRLSKEPIFNCMFKHFVSSSLS